MSPLDNLPDVVWFMGLDLKTSAMIIAAVSIVHPLAYGCTCCVPWSYIVLTIWCFVAFFFIASIVLFWGLVQNIALLCSIWIWYTLIFAPIMIVLMILLIVSFSLRRQLGRVGVVIMGILWYILTIYFVFLVNGHRKSMEDTSHNHTIQISESLEE